MQMIPYGRQSINAADRAAVVAALSGEYLTQGPTIQNFEQALCDYTGAQFAVVFNSGTAALHAAYFALGLKKGDEFITTPLTFAATANAGLYLEAKPVFVDIDPTTGNLDPAAIESKITKKTRLISVVHYAGNPAELATIRAVAARHNLLVVDDACHALGAEYESQKIGSLPLCDATILSFHPVKHITTGEGGAVLCHSEAVYKLLCQFRSHGITKDEQEFQNESDGPWYHEMQFLGFNYRMTDIQAALGMSQLKRLPQFLEKRRAIADTYRTAFANSAVIELPVVQSGSLHAYHLFPILLKPAFASKRKQFFYELKEQGVGAQVHYIPVSDHPYYRQLGYQSSETPHARSFYEREISIPLFPALTAVEVKRVVSAVHAACKHVQ